MSAARLPSWISFHIYHQPDGAAACLHRIRPFVEQLDNEGLIRQFFFIRYSDKRGLHIRLRLRPTTPAASRDIKRRLAEAFSTGAFIKYVPETERYGGPAGMPIAEQLFEASSRAVLQLVTAPAWNLRRALAGALQMHIGMLQAFGLSRNEMIALLRHIALPRAGASDKDLLDQFEKAFLAQQEAIVAPLKDLWTACEQNITFNDTWFREWRQAMTAVGAELMPAYEADKLRLPSTGAHDSPLWSLYESYIHMTNNRLGIKRIDEAFAAYVLHRSLT